MPALFRRNLVIRAFGLALLVVATACLTALFRGPAARGGGGWPAALQATIGFFGASVGIALLLLGHHMLDRIAVSGRWARVEEHPASTKPSALPDAD